MPIACARSSVPPRLVRALLRRAAGVTSVAFHGNAFDWTLTVTFRGATYYLDRQLGEIQAFASHDDACTDIGLEFAEIVERLPRSAIAALRRLLRTMLP